MVLSNNRLLQPFLKPGVSFLWWCTKPRNWNFSRVTSYFCDFFNTNNLCFLKPALKLCIKLLKNLKIIMHSLCIVHTRNEIIMIYTFVSSQTKPTRSSHLSIPSPSGRAKNLCCSYQRSPSQVVQVQPMPAECILVHQVPSGGTSYYLFFGRPCKEHQWLSSFSIIKSELLNDHFRFGLRMPLT